MDTAQRIERALSHALDRAAGPECPAGLTAAVRHAVFPGGARIRPRLCLSVARACGEDQRTVTDAAATALEMLHCASLVHDDLPCFDDAAVRRGRPSVHAAFGERTAILCGDALIVYAFQTLAYGVQTSPSRLGPLLTIIGASAGMPFGIVAGQAWESEQNIPLALYQRAKTGALFAAATAAGAASAGHDPEPWRRVGDFIGEAYQVADDLKDVYGSAADLGKPTGQDEALGRPNAVAQLGFEGAVNRLKNLLSEARAAIPPCSGAADFHSELLSQATRLMPRPRERPAA
jgi:geranylgeranyl diphosphate synthase type II